MFEIIPNWHPFFVHFTLGLLIISFVLYLVTLCFPANSTLRNNLTLVANWNLWIGYAFALVTACFGWLAFNSVAHDSASHTAMTIHRNWALTTLGMYLPVVIWSLVRAKNNLQTGWLFMIALLVPTVLLGGTGWRGSEVVYRYGLGVMSLPRSEEHNHTHGDHDHGSSHEESHEHTHDEQHSSH